VHPTQAEEESIFRTFLLGGGDVEGRSGLFSSFSVVLECVFTGDD